MVNQSPRIGLDRYQKGEDWDHTDLVNQVDQVTPIGTLKTGTFTLSGGSTPAADVTITGVSSNETSRPARLTLNVDSGTTHAQDYSFNCGNDNMQTAWDQSAGQWDVRITVPWDTDPGGGNDVTVSYRIYEE
jgi:hypothetical protein